MQTDNLNISAIRAFEILQKLLEKDCKKSELLNNFSDDSLLLYINTLKERGINILTPNSRHGYYSIKTAMNWLKLSTNDLKLLKEIKKYLSKISDYQSIMLLNEFLDNIKIYTNISTSKKLAEIINSKPFGVNLHPQLRELEKFIQNSALILISYNSPNSGKNYFKLLPKELKIKNQNIYLWSYDDSIDGERGLLIERIEEIHKIIPKENNKDNMLQVTCCFAKNLETNLALDLNIKIIDNGADKIIATIQSHNKFELIQKILSYGIDCEILAPQEIREQIINKIKLMKRNYE